MNAISNERPTMVVSYRYGLHPPLDWDDECENQLKLQVDFWNTLVDIETAYVANVRAVSASAPDVADARQAFDDIKAELDALYKVPPSQRDQAAIDAVLEVKRAAAAVLKEANKKAYSTPEAKERLSALQSKWYDDVRTARQAANANKLWWCNANAVVESYVTARGRAVKTGGELRKQYFAGGGYGEGRLTNQIQGGATVFDLFLHKKSQVAIGDLLRRRGRKCEIRPLTVTAFTWEGERRNVTFPMVYHRPLPPEARIMGVTVHRAKERGRLVWYAVFVCRVPAPDPILEGDRLAINLGWRTTPYGLRVLTYVRQTPDANGDYRECDDGHIYLENRVVDLLDKAAHYVSRRDTARNELYALLPALRETGYVNVENEQVSIGTFFAIRDNALFEMENPELHASLKEALREWRYCNINQARSRARAIGFRQHCYRMAAVKLLEGVSSVVVNGHDMSRTAKKDGGLTPPARANRVKASPSDFRSAILNRARNMGVTVIERPIAHDRCGCHNTKLLLKNKDMLELHWTCPVTNQPLDQDIDFCRLLLRFDSTSDRDKVRNTPAERKTKTNRKVANKDTAAFPAS
jgi:hypothetical protein